MVKALSVDDMSEIIKVLKSELRIAKKVNAVQAVNSLHLETFINHLSDVYDALPAPKAHKNIVIPKGKQDVIANMMLSDWHHGKLVSKSETGGQGEYNITIMKRRARELVRRVKLEIHKQRGVSNIRKLIVHLLGDMLEGNGIFLGQASRLSTHVVQQLLIMVDELAVFLLALEPDFDSIEVICMSGNHSRIGQKDENVFQMNYEYLMAKMLQMKLQNAKRITFTIPDAWFYTKKIWKTTMYLSHGDTVKGMNIAKSVQELSVMESDNGNVFNLMLMGHLHSYKIFEYQQGKDVIVNGALCGNDMYATRRLHLTSSPTQVLFGINKQGVDFICPIKLK